MTTLRLLTGGRSKRTWYRLILFLCSLWFLAWGAAKLLIVDAPLEYADAIAVLSGSAVIRERAQFAAQLYKEGRARRIILTNDNQQSGWSNVPQRKPFYYETAMDLPTRAPVPREAIAVLPQPQS